MEKKEFRLQVDKETKNATVFQQVVEAGVATVIRSLYLPKWFVGNTKHIKVTIEEDK